jgi:hypothetical protein
MRLLFAVFSTCFNLTLFLAETWAQPMKLTVSYTGRPGQSAGCFSEAGGNIYQERSRRYRRSSSSRRINDGAYFR